MEQGLKILVVDDEPTVSRSVKLLLTHEGHSVEIAVNGKTAMQMLEEGTFDLVITDYLMGDMDGLQLAAQIKARWPERPIIVATAYMSCIEFPDGLPANVNHLLNKPFSMDELRQAINHVRI